MEYLELEGKQIKNHTVYEIEGEYESLLTEYRRKYINKIIDTIQQQIRGISDYKIEEWVEEHLISEIKISGRRQNNRIVSALEETFEVLINHSDQNLDMSYSRYIEYLNDIERKSRNDFLEDISLDFINVIIRKIEQYYDCFYGITDRNFESSLENIRYELRPNIRRINEQFQEEYESMIKVALKNNQNKMNGLIAEFKEQNMVIPEEYISQVAKMLEYNNLELLIEENQLYIRDKKENKVYELTYNHEYKQFNTKHSLGMQIIDGSMVYINIDEDLLLVDDQISLEISDISRQYIIKVSQGLTGYEFYFSNQKVSNEEEILKLIKAIEIRCPGYYNKLLQEPEFVQLISKQSTDNIKTKDNSYISEQPISSDKSTPSYFKESQSKKK